MGDQKINHIKDEYSQASKDKIIIIGLGNTLLQDAGIGVHIIQELQKMNLPDNIELIDGGTAGLDLMDYMNKGVDKVIIIDAVKGGRTPGTVFRLSANEIMTTTKHIFSIHQADLVDAIKMIDLFGRKPQEIVIIGVVPDEIEWALNLSPVLQSKIPEIIRVILDEIEKK